MTNNNFSPTEINLAENAAIAIPFFPYSKKLTLDDKNEIENFVRSFPPYSDYNFTSLYCYNVKDKVEISWLNGNLVVLFQDYMTDDLFYRYRRLGIL